MTEDRITEILNTNADNFTKRDLILKEINDCNKIVLAEQKHLILEAGDSLKKKTYKYKGKATIGADFRAFGGRKIEIGDENEFESFLSDEEESFNQALTDYQDKIKKI